MSMRLEESNRVKLCRLCVDCDIFCNKEVEKRVPTLTPLERSDLGVYHIRELTRASKVYQIPVFSVRHLVIYNRTRLHPT